VELDDSLGKREPAFGCRSRRQRSFEAFADDVQLLLGDGAPGGANRAHRLALFLIQAHFDRAAIERQSQGELQNAVQHDAHRLGIELSGAFVLQAGCIEANGARAGRRALRGERILQQARKVSAAQIQSFATEIEPRERLNVFEEIGQPLRFLLQDTGDILRFTGEPFAAGERRGEARDRGHRTAHFLERFPQARAARLLGAPLLGAILQERDESRRSSFGSSNAGDGAGDSQSLRAAAANFGDEEFFRSVDVSIPLLGEARIFVLLEEVASERPLLFHRE